MESTQIWFFPKAPNKIRVLRLYLQMKLSLPLAIGIPTLTLQHWFGILSEHHNSSVGRSMYGLITRRLWLTPMTYLLVLQMRLDCDLCHFPVHFSHWNCQIFQEKQWLIWRRSNANPLSWQRVFLVCWSEARNSRSKSKMSLQRAPDMDSALYIVAR